MKHFLYYLPCLFLAILVSCKKDLKNNPDMLMPAKSLPENAKASFVNTFYGPQVEVGSGKVKSFVSISHDGAPLELGLIMTAGALQNLPQAPAGATSGHGSFYHIPLHQKATAVTPFTHVDFGWLPVGHPPAGSYTFPHFDIYFFMISEAERMAIPSFNPATNAALFAAPPPGVIPADYTFHGPPAGRYGKHWLDATSPALPPATAPFTHELIYGTFDAKVVFLAQMIRHSFLQTGMEVHQAIKQPTIYNPTGTYYPTRYNIYTDAKTGNIIISFDQFVWR